MMAPPAVTLHTYFRSSSSARLRIALNLKIIPYNPVFVNLATNEQKTSAYLSLNPGGTVPLLIHAGTSVGQSSAALEYLEEAFPDAPPLLPPPSDPAGRAFVRELVALVVADMQPVTSLRVVAAVAEAGGDKSAWTRSWTARGLGVYEGLLARGDKGGPFSYGGRPTMADACLVPAVWNWQVGGSDLGDYPRVQRVFVAMMALEGVREAHWRRQEDAPAEVREEKL